MMRMLSAVALVLCVGPLAAQQPKAAKKTKPAAARHTDAAKPCYLLLLNVGRSGQEQEIFGNNKVYDAAGNVRLQCRDQQVFLNTDSLSALSGDYVRLYGHAVYRDTAYRIQADTMIYTLRTEKLEARGHVVVLDKSSSSTLAGPYVDYWRQVKGINDSAKVVAVQRPTVRYFVRDSATGKSDQRPYILTGQTLQGFGQSHLWGGGDVSIERDSLKGTGDSLAFDRGKTAVAQLIGTAATLRRTGADSFAVFGKEIRITLEDDKLHDLRAFRDARVKRGLTDITGDTVQLGFTSEKLSLTTAWARQAHLATLRSAGYFITGDSLAVDSPMELLREIRVFKQGTILSPRDTVSEMAARIPGDSTPTDTTRNTLRGERIIARFDQVDSAGTTITRLRGLQSYGRMGKLASSLFSRQVNKDGHLTPSVTYTMADSIVVRMNSGDSSGVALVQAYGHVNGIQLEKASVPKPKTDTAKVTPPVKRP